MSEDRSNNGNGGRTLPINLGMLHPIGTPYVTPLHALSPGAQSLPSLMIAPPRDRLVSPTDTGVQYLSQGPTGPIPMSQVIDPSLAFLPGTGAHTALQANIGRATDVALSAGPGVIGGERALTAARFGEIPEREMGTLDAALAAEQGLHEHIPNDPTSIFHATGWFRGADDKWRFIIPDEGARLRTENLNPNRFREGMYGVPVGKGTTLEDVLDHPDLYTAYPWAKDIKVNPMPIGNIFNLNGSYSPGLMHLTGSTEDKMLSTLLHETQHAIQDHEGFARGGNTAEFLPSTFDEDMRGVKQSKEEIEKEIYASGVEPNLVSKIHGFHPYTEPSIFANEGERSAVGSLPQSLVNQYRYIQGLYKGLLDEKSAAFQDYLNLGGEIEARSVQAMLHEHQWSRPPWEVPMGRDFMGNPIPYPERTEHIIKFNEPRGGNAGVVLTPVEHDPFATPPGR